jgi:hypothetical protein
VTEDFWGYADQRRRECAELSVSDDELDYREEEGSHGKRGQIHGHIQISFEIDAYLDVKEIVVVEHGHPHREEYAYTLVVEGEELWCQERDPQHAPDAVHYHARRHKGRHSCEPIAFKAAVELAWQHVSHVLEFGLADYDPLAPEARDFSRERARG